MHTFAHCRSVMQHVCNNIGLIRDNFFVFYIASEEEISAMKTELDKYGIQMPHFGKIGGILANEVSTLTCVGDFPHFIVFFSSFPGCVFSAASTTPLPYVHHASAMVCSQLCLIWLWHFRSSFTYPCYLPPLVLLLLCTHIDASGRSGM